MSKEFQWTDELVMEYAHNIHYHVDRNHILNQPEAMKVFKQSHTPKPQPQKEEQRIEVMVYSGGIDCKNGMFSHTFVSKSLLSSEEAFKIKQAIEQVLNDDHEQYTTKSDIMKDLEKLVDENLLQYTQQQVDEIEERAFNVARAFPIKAGGITTGIDPHIFKFPTFQDYKNFQPKSTTTTFKQPEDITEL